MKKSHEKKKSKINSVIIFVFMLIFITCSSMLMYAAMIYYTDSNGSYLPIDKVMNVSETNILSIDESNLINIRATDILDEMSVEQKVGELFMIKSNGIDGICDIISNTKAGGVVLFAKDFNGKDSSEVQAMINEMQSASDGKMLVAVDEEGGTVVRISSNSKLRSSKFKSPQDLYAKGGFELIKSDTEEKCALLKSLLINMNFAPVADVCTNKNGFMYKRAFPQSLRCLLYLPRLHIRDLLRCAFYNKLLAVILVCPDLLIALSGHICLFRL